MSPPKEKKTDSLIIQTLLNENAEKWAGKWRRQEISEQYHEGEKERRARQSNTTVCLDDFRQSGSWIVASRPQTEDGSRAGSQACTGHWNPNCRCQAKFSKGNGLGITCALALQYKAAPRGCVAERLPSTTKEGLRKWALGSSKLGTSWDVALGSSTGSLPQIGYSGPTRATIVRTRSASDLARSKLIGGPWRPGRPSERPLGI